MVVVARVYDVGLFVYSNTEHEWIIHESGS